MIHALYLNPTIDQTVYLDSFEMGGTNRIKRQLTQGGGKAVNVAILLHHLGEDVCVHGFLYLENAAPIRSALSGINSRLSEYPGACRVNTKVVDLSRAVTTEINGFGPDATPTRLQAMEEALLAAATPQDILVCTGSLPPGCAKDTYTSIMRRFPGRTVLDADGAALAQALAAKPWLIKPNKDELCRLLGQQLSTKEELLAAACRLTQKGVGIVAVSLGSEGALITDGKQAFFAPPLHVKVDSTVGAGDSMLGGMLTSLSKSDSLADALAMGVAAASASIALPGTALAEKSDILALLEQVRILPMDIPTL
ncbi:MAG: hexose kinase [Christensenellaceae bacterium]|nr:hexose kinase [Christensenellaceae bacterium]